MNKHEYEQLAIAIQCMAHCKIDEALYVSMHNVLVLLKKFINENDDEIKIKEAIGLLETDIKNLKQRDTEVRIMLTGLLKEIVEIKEYLDEKFGNITPWKERNE